MDEGDGDTECSHSKDGEFKCLWCFVFCFFTVMVSLKNKQLQCNAQTEVEIGSSADQSTSSSAAPPQKKEERQRSDSSGSIDRNRLITGPVGGGITSAGKLMLHIPMGPQSRTRRVHSPSYMRRE